MKFTRIDEFYNIDSKILPLKISNSTPEDIDSIFNLYRLGADFQRSKFLENIWPEFDRQLVVSEIEDNRQFKIVINDEIACVWAVTFDDPAIWEEKNIDPSVYIHRIATNPKFRGQNFVQHIVDWAKVYEADEKPKKEIAIGISKSPLKYSGELTEFGFELNCESEFKDCWENKMEFKKVYDL